MKTRKGKEFRNQLSEVIPDVEYFTQLFKKSPALYDYYIDKSR
jgi:hypothetical protein